MENNKDNSNINKGKSLFRFRRGLTLPGLAMATLPLVIAANVHAFELEFAEDSELSGNVDVTLGYGTSFRATDADLSAANLVGMPNIASEVRAPDKGDQISQVLKATVELGLDWRNYGLVSSVAYQYDTEIMHDGTGQVAFTGDANGLYGLGDDWAEETEDEAGNALDLLDLYVYGTYDIGENPLEVRVGKQVINWGEGLFFLDGVSAQVPLNINKLVTPGSELKEAYIGVNSIYAQMGVGEQSSLEAYVQTDWKRTEFPAHGTFYGDDLLFRGSFEAWNNANNAVAPFGMAPGLRGEDVLPSDSGQWGISGRTTVGDTELGVYYSRYHDTFPLLSFESNPLLGGLAGATVRQNYVEDLDLIGFSASTTLGAWSVNGELAYRPDRPLQRNIGDFLFVQNGLAAEEHDTWSGSVHGIWLGGELPLGIDSQVGLVQFGADYIDGDVSNLQAHGSITKESLAPDDLAYGVAVEWTGTWQAVYPGTDISLDVYLQKDLQGNSHFWGNFAEDRVLGTVSLIANIGNEWEASAGYSWTHQDNSHYDTQDLYNLSVNYKF